MDELKEQLEELNELAAHFYDWVETNRFRITRRRLLVLEIMLFVDANINAAAKLLIEEPCYLDGAQMILRSVYDIGVSGDWILSSKDNKRLWRWLRDDRKTLYQQTDGLVGLFTANPKLVTKEAPLDYWKDALKSVRKELTRGNKNAGTTDNDGTISTFQKARSQGDNSQRTYHTVFWLFSNSTHASATGLAGLAHVGSRGLLELRRRGATPTSTDERDALNLMKTGLTWYAAHIHQTVKYLGAPQAADAKRLLDRHLGRN